MGVFVVDPCLRNVRMKVGDCSDCEAEADGFLDNRINTALHGISDGSLEPARFSNELIRMRDFTSRWWLGTGLGTWLEGAYAPWRPRLLLPPPISI